MWSRKELKKKGKAAFKKNFWKCVLAAFIVSWLIGSLSQGASSDDGTIAETISQAADSISGMELSETQEAMVRFLQSAAARYLVIASGVLSIILLALKIFVFQVFEIGGCKFFLNNVEDKGQLKDLLYAFQAGGYWKAVEIQTVKRIFVSLWAVLFIIPGIVKNYEYCMIPYLLAENPRLSRKEAFRLSKEMMRGNKWNKFKLDMSFLGWELLSAFTAGITGVLYSTPYYMATKAELYLALKGENQGQ